MGLSTQRAVDAITTHSLGLAEAAAGTLSARVEHCPDWSVADLVWHVTEVHWFWRRIVAERPPSRPDWQRPGRPPQAELVAGLVEGARALVATLAGADQQAPCWTWYPRRQDVGFVTRHQVQEAAVHHWDAVHAAGSTVRFARDVAVDSVEEFLTCSLADAEDAASRPPLLGDLVLRADDAGLAWTVHQREDGELRWRPADPGPSPTVGGTASDLLLWLYRRVDLPVADAHRGLVASFRALSSPD